MSKTIASKKVDHFNIFDGEFDRIDEALKSRGLTADDVISITYNSKKDLYLVWFKA